jgi:Fe-S-cluster containining protein
MDKRGDILKDDETKPNTEEKSKNEETKKDTGKYVFQCQKCGQCCESMDSVAVSLADLKQWSNDLTLPSLFPYLTIELKNDNFIQISLKKPESREGETQKGCPLYDENNKICNIHFSMPLYCGSFPLGFDGKNYFLKDKDCQGLGKGQMTQEDLKSTRESAKDDFEARVSSQLLLPVIHGLTMAFILNQSKKRIDELTPDQKDKLSEILGKQENKKKQ